MSFYDDMSPYYHIIFENWNDSVIKQGEVLASTIKKHLGDETREILDVSCGIGTQTLGLALQGFEMTASDLSKGEIERAKSEAQKLSMDIPFSVCDMKRAFEHHQRQFDLVISCDNSVPHLLSDDEILEAFQQFYLCTKTNGACLITVRDYTNTPETGENFVPLGVRNQDGLRYMVYQVWQHHGRHYDLSMYFTCDDGSNSPTTQVFNTRYYAVTTKKLTELLSQAGFNQVQLVPCDYYQPVLIGIKN